MLAWAIIAAEFRDELVYYLRMFTGERHCARVSVSSPHGIFSLHSLSVLRGPLQETLIVPLFEVKIPTLSPAISTVQFDFLIDLAFKHIAVVKKPYVCFSCFLSINSVYIVCS